MNYTNSTTLEIAFKEIFHRSELNSLLIASSASLIFNFSVSSSGRSLWLSKKCMASNRFDASCRTRRFPEDHWESFRKYRLCNFDGALLIPSTGFFDISDAPLASRVATSIFAAFPIIVKPQQEYKTINRSGERYGFHILFSGWGWWRVWKWRCTCRRFLRNSLTRETSLCET